ncbi:MAG: hypothetical protein ABIA76_04395 [Candidatus Diapherotrites archaeon]
MLPNKPFKERTRGNKFFGFKEELKKNFDEYKRPLKSGELSTNQYREAHYKELKFTPKRVLQIELSLLNLVSGGKVTANEIRKKASEEKKPFFEELQETVDAIIKERWADVGHLV